MNSLDDIIEKHNVVVCVGSGGVGKTTTSAVVALHAALAGRKTMVLTIDPARRLANSLGITGIDHKETRISLSEQLEIDIDPKGELWAMMLEMKHAFDQMVKRNTGDFQAVDRILSNKFYHYFSSSLAGSQEYSAVEQLHELHVQGRYDLLVLDTPPTQHALDFLNAPARVHEALESSALQWMFRPALASGKIGLGVVKFGARFIRRTLGKLTGGNLLEDMSVFLESLAPLMDGYRERAGRVQEILHNPTTVFLVVTTLDPLTLSDATFLGGKLEEQSAHFGGYIVNRVHQPTVLEGEQWPQREELTELLLSLPGARYMTRHNLRQTAASMLRNGGDFTRLADKDREMLAQLLSEQQVPVFPIPFYSRDIHSLKGLNRVRRDLFDDD